MAARDDLLAEAMAEGLIDAHSANDPVWQLEELTALLADPYGCADR